VMKGQVILQGQRSNISIKIITYAILKIATWYLACMCISWSCTFWVVKGQGHPSRSKVKYMDQNCSKGDIVHCVSQTHTCIVFHKHIPGSKFRNTWSFSFCSLGWRVTSQFRGYSFVKKKFHSDCLTMLKGRNLCMKLLSFSNRHLFH